jgi:hypothetical protein
MRSRPGARPIGWAADGRSLFILTPAGAHWQLAALDLATRRIEALPAPPLRVAAAATDGRSIFAMRPGENKLLRIDPARGIVRQYRLPPSAPPAVLLPAAGAVYMIEDRLGSGLVSRLDLATGAIARVATLEEYGGGAASLHPDGRSIAYTRSRESANDLAWIRL